MNVNVSSTIDWKSELKKTALKYHTITLWVAVIFNMLFFITDYINIYEYWKEFLTFRSVVTVICLITVLFHKRLKLSVELMGVIPVLLISIENAYMWSLMDVAHFQKHAFAYMALFIGSGMFVFYHVYYSIFIVVANIGANIIFLYFNSSLSTEEILVNGGFLTGSVAIFSILLIRMRYRLTKKELIARLALERSKKEIEEKNQEIVDSINYAKRIQTAIIPSDSIFKRYLPNSFVLFKPKDIVSGDFYWMEHIGNTVLFAAADCTGHGVPGAMVSVICNNGLNRSVREFQLRDPAQILEKTREIVIKEFEKSEEEVKDGMDIALCSLNGKSLEYAGAHNPLWIVRNGEILETKADKQPIGKFENATNFNTNSFELEEGDTVYIFSDGFADQFGGPKGKKLKYSRFKKFLIENVHLSLEDQKQKLNQLFEEWKGGLEQLDDVCLIGVRI